MASKNNDFLDSLKVDIETQAKLATVSKNYSNKQSEVSSKRSVDEGGKERGDEGPGSLGRESGIKSGNKEQLNNCFRVIREYQNSESLKTHRSIQNSGVNHTAKMSHGNVGTHGISMGGSKSGHIGGSHGSHSGASSGSHGTASSGGHGSSGGGHGR